MKQFPFLIAAGFLVLVGGLAIWLSSCNSGSEIPIDPEPTCVELVTDECVPEVVAEFCDDCDYCFTSEEYTTNLNFVFNLGVDSVVCETTDPVCEDDIDEDCEDDSHKAVHKRCRGGGHHKAGE